MRGEDMFIRTKLALIVAGLALAGCAAGPQPGDVTTGSLLPSMPSLPSLPALPSAGSLLPSMAGASSAPRPAERVSGNLYRVLPDGRRIDDPIQRENYALLRAAEATQWAGGTHFIVVNATGQAGPGRTGVPGMLIRILRLDSGGGPELPIGAVAAEEMVHFFGPSFGRGVARDGTSAAGSPG